MLYYRYGFDMPGRTPISVLSLTFQEEFDASKIPYDTLCYIVETIDKNKVNHARSYTSPIFGELGPDDLSNGAKNVMLPYFMDDIAIYSRYLGNNCLEPLLYTCKEHDVYLCVDTQMAFTPEMYEKYPNLIYNLDYEQLVTSYDQFEDLRFEFCDEFNIEL